ncbi:hypothetical protein Tco_0256217 [Tanacetum coccineum]
MPSLSSEEFSFLLEYILFDHEISRMVVCMSQQPWGLESRAAIDCPKTAPKANRLQSHISSNVHFQSGAIKDWSPRLGLNCVSPRLSIFSKWGLAVEERNYKNRKVIHKHIQSFVRSSRGRFAIILLWNVPGALQGQTACRRPKVPYGQVNVSFLSFGSKRMECCKITRETNEKTIEFVSCKPL